MSALTADRDAAAGPVEAIIGRAQRLLAHGYPPVPILRPDAPATITKRIGGEEEVVKQTPGKQPHNALWARKEREVYGATASTVAAWARLRNIADYPGLGIACGKVVGADLDIYEPDLADRIEALATQRLGTTSLRRVGQPPKRLLVYRAAGEPLVKAQTPELWKGGLKGKVEVLGRGQQFVAFGVHPDTKRPYAWGDVTPDDTSPDELPAITQAQVEAFVAEAEAMLRATGYRTKAEIEAESCPADPQPRPAAKPAARPNGAGVHDTSPFKAVNDAALARPEAWARALFPRARRSANGAWRVSSRNLGRDLEEDLSIAPTGVVDFGVHDLGDPRQGKRTPIDLVMEHGEAADALQAARWLAELLGLEHLFDSDKQQKSTSSSGQPPEDDQKQNGSEQAEESQTTAGHGWPEPLAPEAFHGIVGEIVRTIEPETEAAPAALLFQLLTAAGNLIGPDAYVTVEATKHPPRLNVVQVGRTGKARKGTSWNRVKAVLRLVAEDWARDRIVSGLSSGEGLIYQVRDPVTGHEGDKKTGAPREVVVDPGVEDKRLLVVEEEFAKALQVMDRQGSTLSAVLRTAWESGNLRTLVKNSPNRATGAHVSLIGHITADELRRCMDRTEMANGFANRLIFVCVHRSKELPRGGRPIDWGPIEGRLRRVPARVPKGEIRRTDAFWELWEEVYSKLSADRPGMLGAILGRAEAQVLRLSLIYALLDGSAFIDQPHLLAALACWDYAEASVRFVFGDSLGDPIADEILSTLRGHPEGLAKTELSNHFGRNLGSDQIGRALAMLARGNFVASAVEKQARGRPTERWRAVR
jgi:hypothetical protein